MKPKKNTAATHTAINEIFLVQSIFVNLLEYDVRKITEKALNDVANAGYNPAIFEFSGAILKLNSNAAPGNRTAAALSAPQILERYFNARCIMSPPCAEAYCEFSKPKATNLKYKFNYGDRFTVTLRN